MPPNVKDTIVIGGLTLLGYMAGGKLGSMFGAVIGTVVCSLFSGETPTRPNDHFTAEFTPNTSYPRLTNGPIRKRKNNKSNDKDSSNEQSKCAICLEPFKPTILLLPCLHMCFCEECFEKVRKQKVNKCPICRYHIDEFRFIYPS